jgi:hypothetical protein
MKKIKSIKELRQERNKLRDRQAELEKAIQYDWRDFKDDLKPGYVAGQLLGTVCAKPEKKRNGFSGSLFNSFGSRFIRKMFSTVGGRMRTWFK